MSQAYMIERQIEIDAGHRVTHHGSKCKNLHGHRYTVIAVCHGPLLSAGEQQGMVLDFGFLKEEMIKEVHNYCDHAMILWIDDPLVQNFIDDKKFLETEICQQVAEKGYYYTDKSLVGALYIINSVPTAENLAAHWFKRLEPRVQARSDQKAHLRQVKVFETPNCMAIFPA